VVLCSPVFRPSELAGHFLDDFDEPKRVETVEEHACGTRCKHENSTNQKQKKTIPMNPISVGTHRGFKQSAHESVSFKMNGNE